MPQPSPEVIIRLGSHAEKEYIVKLAKFFNGIIVGANLFESTPGATASLLVSVKARTTHIYVDPMTYAFGAYQDPETGKLCTDLDWIKSEQIKKTNGVKNTVRDFKKSYRQLAGELGGAFKKALAENSAVAPIQLSDSGTVTAMCQRVATYQLERIAREFREDAELRDFAEDAPTPAAVFAPYFYIEPSHTRDWLNLNIRLMTASGRLDLPAPVHAILCADVTHIEDRDFQNAVVEAAQKSGIKGMWLWFSGFFEEKAGIATLAQYRGLVEKLSKFVSVYALHGGFFSLALREHGMRGISHGIGYGEQKDVVPVIGQSTPTVRYYLPPAARRLGVPEIERSFRALKIATPKDFHERVCGCAVCVGVVSQSIEEFAAFGDMHLSHPKSQRMAQTPAAAKRCRYHFLLARIRERDEVGSRSALEIAATLNESARVWGTQPSLVQQCQHLPRWEGILSTPSA